MSAPLTSLDRPNSYIGRSVPRPNAKRLRAVRGRYGGDVGLPRMLCAASLGCPLINPGSGNNVCFRSQLDNGSVDDAFAHAAHVVEEEFCFGRHTAVTLEPRAIVAEYDPAAGALTVHHATQTPYQFQDLYSRHYGIPEASVRVIATDIGGSFGMKLHVYHEDMAVVGLSILLGRPVKYVADRIESFVS